MAIEPNTPSAKQLAPLYAGAGVDIAANDRLIPRFQELAAKTRRPEVIGGFGLFSGLFDLSGFRNPVLVASTDGVGSKVLIARALNRFQSVGQDLVNHCINDILTAGAQPLFFLDYLANNGLSEGQKVEVVHGVADSCKAAGLTLLGGETADMPDVYNAGDFDLAGTIIGVVEKGKHIDGAKIDAGDVLIGLPSTGLHTNGYSLVRRVLGLKRADNDEAVRLLETKLEGTTISIGQALLEVHDCYWQKLARYLPDCKGIAHITGGGIFGNLSRILPPGLTAVVDRGMWPELPIFPFIQKQGMVSEKEMFSVFNMGIGLILVVAPDRVEELLDSLSPAYRIGSVQASVGGDIVEFSPPLI